MRDEKDERRMEFWRTIAGLMRRPVVVIPTVMVALALGALAYLGTPTTYVSSTTMVLSTTAYGGTLSQDPTKPTDLTNPLLNFNTSLQTTSAILIEMMGTKDVRQELGVTSGNTQLIINDGRTNPDLLGLNGPFLYIEARSTSAAEARQTVVDAQKVMKKQLTARQAALKAPEQTYLTLEDIVSPTAPVASNSRALKLGVMAFVFGFVLCVGIAYFGHQVRARRRARAAAAPVVADDATTLSTGPEPGRKARPTRTPILVVSGLDDDGAEQVADADEDADDGVAETVAEDKHEDKDEKPASPPTPRTPRPETALVTRSIKRKPEQTVALNGKSESTVVRASVKTNLRSRHR